MAEEMFTLPARVSSIMIRVVLIGSMAPAALELSHRAVRDSEQNRAAGQEIL